MLKKFWRSTAQKAGLKVFSKKKAAWISREICVSMPVYDFKCCYRKYQQKNRRERNSIRGMREEFCSTRIDEKEPMLLKYSNASQKSDVDTTWAKGSLGDCYSLRVASPGDGSMNWDLGLRESLAAPHHNLDVFLPIEVEPTTHCGGIRAEDESSRCRFASRKCSRSSRRHSSECNHCRGRQQRRQNAEAAHQRRR